MQRFLICVRQIAFLGQLTVKLLRTSAVARVFQNRCPNTNDCSLTLCPCRLAALQHAFERWQNSCTALFVRACQQLNHVRTTAWMSWRAAWLIKLIWIQSGTSTLVSVYSTVTVLYLGPVVLLLPIMIFYIFISGYMGFHYG